jgi:RNA polymerase sigma-70 factor (ECF subfamily)
MPTQRPADPDAQLLADLRADRPGAHRRLFDAYWPLFLKLGLSRLPNHADAEDAAIEALADAARNLGSFRGDSTLKTWLVRICLSRVGKVAARSRRETAVTDERLESLAARAEPAADERSRRAFVDLAARIQVLPRGDADAVTLHYLVGLDPDEAAAALSINAAAFRSRLRRGIARLRRDRAREDKYRRIRVEGSDSSHQSLSSNRQTAPRQPEAEDA